MHVIKNETIDSLSFSHSPVGPPDFPTVSNTITSAVTTSTTIIPSDETGPAELTIETIDDTINEEELAPISSQPPLTTSCQPVYYYPTHPWYFSYPQTSLIPAMVPSLYPPVAPYAPPVVNEHVQIEYPPTITSLTSGELQTDSESIVSSPVVEPSSTAPFVAMVTPPLSSPVTQSPSSSPTTRHSILQPSDLSSAEKETPQLGGKGGSDKQRIEFIQSLLVSLQEPPVNTSVTPSSGESRPGSSRGASPTSKPLLSQSPLVAHPVQTNVFSPEPARSLSLQEAFQLKKQAFVQQSQDRVTRLEDSTRERDQSLKTNIKPTKLVKFSSPVLQRHRDTSSTKHTPPSIHKGDLSFYTVPVML